MAGAGTLEQASDIAGSVCPSANNPNQLVSCHNSPTIFEALVASGSLGPQHNMFSIYINQNKSVDGKRRPWQSGHAAQ
jgi:hypothetical protein